MKGRQGTDSAFHMAHGFQVISAIQQKAAAIALGKEQQSPE
jgi:hypothetical protein